MSGFRGSVFAALAVGVLVTVAAAPPRARAQDVVVFDAITGVDPGYIGSVSNASGNHAYMGQAFNADPITGGPLFITRIDVVAEAFTSANYTNVVANVQFWDRSSNGTFATSPVVPAFSQPATPQPVRYALGPLQTFGATSKDLILFQIPLVSAADPGGIALTDFSNLGVSIAFQTDTGAGLQAPSNDLSAAVRNGLNNPFAAGDVPARNPQRNDNTTYYRNASATFDYTTFNFLSSDARDVATDPSLGQFHSSVALRIYAQNLAATPEPGTLALALVGALAGGWGVVRRRNACR